MDKTKLEKYADIQAMVQKEARDIAEQVYAERGTQFGVPTTPYHIHNGLDSPQLNPADFLGFPIVATAPSDKPINGTIRLFYGLVSGGMNGYRIYARINNSWHYVDLT